MCYERLVSNSESRIMKQTDEDKQALAKELRAWRGFAPRHVAAEALGIARRTIENIEMGGGYHAPKLLRIAMAAITCPKRETI